MASRYSELERRVGELEQMLKEVRAELARAKSEGESPAPVVETPAEDQAPQPTSAVTAPAEQRPEAELPMAEVIPTAASESADLGGRERRLPLSGYMDYHVNKLGVGQTVQPQADVPGGAAGYSLVHCPFHPP